MIIKVSYTFFSKFNIEDFIHVIFNQLFITVCVCVPLPLLCGILEPSANSIFRTVCVCVPLPLLYGILEPSANLIFLQLLCPCIFSIPCQLYLKCWLLCTVLAGHSRPLANPIFTFVLSLHRPGPPLANSIYFVGVIVRSWRGTPAPLPTPFTLFLSLQHPGGTLPPPCQLYLHYFYLCTVPARHFRPLANSIYIIVVLAPSRRDTTGPLPMLYSQAPMHLLHT